MFLVCVATTPDRVWSVLLKHASVLLFTVVKWFEWIVTSDFMHPSWCKPLDGGGLSSRMHVSGSSALSLGRGVRWSHCANQSSKSKLMARPHRSCSILLAKKKLRLEGGGRFLLEIQIGWRKNVRRFDKAWWTDRTYTYLRRTYLSVVSHWGGIFR